MFPVNLSLSSTNPTAQDSSFFPSPSALPLSGLHGQHHCHGAVGLGHSAAAFHMELELGSSLCRQLGLGTAQVEIVLPILLLCSAARWDCFIRGESLFVRWANTTEAKLLAVAAPSLTEQKYSSASRIKPSAALPAKCEQLQ